MAAEPKAATEEAKIDLFEDDDEFEEFEINEGFLGQVCFFVDMTRLLVEEGNQGASLMRLIILLPFFSSHETQTNAVYFFCSEWEDKEEGKEVTQQWEDDWDDDDVNDDFSLQLRRELENNTEKN
ncbi:hypothetical protein FH972_019097 [Carpinus fangiana]|uniref:26S proteasome complex subunit SEM1 n=1 Tax=Carpinus fangiana TaxID=176857 RepID=A0A5N6RS49_9ROSI|nr:hypothetical protein FH972_019097 [Carpinus fangiana]